MMILLSGGHSITKSNSFISLTASSFVFSSSFSNRRDLAAALTKWKTAGNVLKREQPVPILSY